MAQKWNLQDIRPIEPRPRPTSRPRESVIEQPRPILHDDPEDTQPVIIEDGNKRRKKTYILGGALGTFVIVGALVLSVVFSETTLTIKPEFRDPNVNAQFDAFPQRREGALTYEVLTLESTKTRQVNATGEKKVEEQARGTIEIFKTTPGPERLIKNTRFESPTGLIFRIEESIVVPGAVEKDGKMVPGSIRATVFADTIGEEYNLTANTRFSIPGFKESKLDDLYASMYATNPEVFAGGFNGPQFIIDETELSTARQELQIELRNELLERIKKERPAGFVAFDGSFAFTYSQLPSVSFGGNVVEIKERALLQVPLFKVDEIAKYIAKQTVPTYNEAPVRIESFDGMLFSYKDPNHSASVIADLASLSFTLVGRPRIIWEYDEEELRASLAGKPKTAVAQAVSAYTGTIKSAEVSIKPFYRQSFPDNPAEIRIIEVIEEEN